ncbi:biotin transporter BioY [Thermogladius sp. 4427co]|uniref:biotin transporter BioY n=1 Tax=Thermogladius sp. 4427co TaxID=3450718 RepID=UPI003F7A858D
MLRQEYVVRNRLWEKARKHLKTFSKNLLEIVAGVALLTASSKVSIVTPFSPVPFTFQTLVLIYLILLYRGRAWRPVIAYFTLGMLGLPVFAYGGGLAYIFSPTFGYLLGFILASILGGRIVSRKPLTYSKITAAALVSMLAIYTLGYIHLTVWLTTIGRLSFGQALTKAFVAGVLLFITWDTFKALIAVGLIALTNRVNSILNKEIGEYLKP